ncbi:sensor histidine kinase [Enterococcus sp.]|uniref:sensor histidine kinase n=1 Tax=Enterococcus sp. TaxID=35783 RepID=UPI002911C6AD|nr:ATP-binding protein [Enterococcus sp.]MDU5336587.1 ATP-binding protein [Enterococcus sp.]
MENLKYVIEDEKIAELLGIGNFSNKESAVLELVKNAYDAGANFINIDFKKDSGGKLIICIQDDGRGMNEDDITNKWMHVGKSNKNYLVSQSSQESIKYKKRAVRFRSNINKEKIVGFKNTRITAGSKGIGRFALARLSKETTMHTKNKSDETIKWYTNWKETNIYNDIKESDKIKNNGTIFVLSELRDTWDESSIIILKEFLSRSYDGKQFSINLTYGGVSYPVKAIFSEPRLGVNYTSRIDFKYNSKSNEIHLGIICDEFDAKSEEIIGYKSFPIVEKSVIKAKEYFETTSIYKTRKKDIYGEMLPQFMERIGDFSGTFFFSLQNISRIDKERFFYKHNALRKRYKQGIILYRNAFSISSYDGSKDWIKLAQRASESTAAASHPRGKWRVSPTQLSGTVLIDKKRNKHLKDLSNRQGLDENAYYHLMIDLISIALSNFEEFRQGIIRKLKVHSDNQVEQVQDEKKESLKTIIKNPEKILDLKKNELVKVAKDFSKYSYNSSIIEKSSKEKEEQYRYEIRLLNVLATSGLKAMSVAHELDNKRNNLATNYDHIVKALMKYDMWKDLNSSRCQRRSHNNVPRLLSKNKETNNKLLRFLDTILEEVEIEFFDIEKMNIELFLNKIVTKWNIEYPSLKNISLKKYGDEDDFCVSKDAVNVILDNLILNSIQQNEKGIEKLEIEVSFEIVDDAFSIKYSDNGVGLSEKFINSPFKILEPHESTRDKGHGLGMWLVNSSVLSTDGTVNNIDGHNGFLFECVLYEQEEKKGSE